MRKKRSIQTVLIGLIVMLLTVLQQKGYLQPAAEVAVQNQPGLYAVTEFSDGDTISVDMNGTAEKVRFIGVDTPETHDPRKNVQCYGEAASAYTKQLIGKNLVRLEADPENTNRDRYNRLLRYVYLPDNTMVNAELIKNGYGFAYTYFPFSKSDLFRGYEAEARNNNRGLWSSCPIVEKENEQTSTGDAP